jgi:hypothetical protein
MLDNISDICITRALHLAQVNDVFIDIEPLVSSSDGAAWVIGMKPTQ